DGRKGPEARLRPADPRSRDRAEQAVPVQVTPGRRAFAMSLDRRTFLRTAGVSLALPWLEAFAPAQARAAAAAPPRRMVSICAPLGLHAPNLFTAEAGNEYRPTPYLEVLQEFRSDFTLMSRLSHPDIDSSHDSIFSFRTAAP